MKILAGLPELTPRYTQYYCIFEQFACIRPNVKHILVRLTLPVAYSKRLEEAGVGPKEDASLKWHHRWTSLYRVTKSADVPQAIRFIRAAADLTPTPTQITIDRATLEELEAACRHLGNVVRRVLTKLK